MQVLIIVIVFSLIYFLSLQGGVQMEPVVAAIIGVITAIAANIVVEVFGWKKVGQKIGSLS